MEQLLALLVVVGTELATQAAKDIFAKFLKKLLDDDKSSLEELYTKLLVDIRGIIGDALEQRDIKEIESMVKALKGNLDRILGGKPEDIKAELALASNDAMKLWEKTMSFGDKTMPAFFITTALLFIIDKEYQRVQPESSLRHQTNSLSIYALAKQHFNADEFVQRKIGNDINKTPLNMDEQSRVSGHRTMPGRREGMRTVPVYTQYYRHWFDWNGKTYDCGWQTNRVGSHGDGINLRDKTIREAAETFKQQVTKISMAWDSYADQLKAGIELEKSLDASADIEEAVKMLSFYENDLKAFLVPAAKPAVKILTAAEVADLKLSPEAGKPFDSKQDEKSLASSITAAGSAATASAGAAAAGGTDKSKNSLAKDLGASMAKTMSPAPAGASTSGASPSAVKPVLKTPSPTPAPVLHG